MPVWVVASREQDAARWARLLFRLGAEAARASSLRELEGCGAEGLALIEWELLAGDPGRALKSLRGGEKKLEVIVWFGSSGGGVPDPAGVFEAGALDVVSLAVSDQALDARVSGHLEKYFPPLIKSGGLRVDRHRRQAAIRSSGGAWTPVEELTPKEFGLLLLFIRHPGVRRERGDLMARVWGGNSGNVNPEAVDRQVSSLRRKLGPQGRRIRTLRGVGYVFEAEGR